MLLKDVNERDNNPVFVEFQNLTIHGQSPCRPIDYKVGFFSFQNLGWMDRNN